MLKTNRRHFLAGTAAMAAFPTAPIAARHAILEAKIGQVQLVPGNYPKTEIWGYDGGVPGPEIRAPQGGRISRKLVNTLPQPTAVHWHGMRIPNDMDGVPGLTQDAVPTGGSFDYDLPLPDAGTFWYHSHNQSTEQVARGLYGVLIVEESTPPDVDHDITLVLDDWRLSQQAQITDDIGAMHDWSHGGRMGNYIHATQSPNTSGVQQNQRLRLRIVNVATDRIMVISMRGLVGKVVAFDGMPLETPQNHDLLWFGPAQRVDLLVDVTAAPGESAKILLHQGDQAHILSEIPVTGRAGRTARKNIPALPQNPLQRLRDLSDNRRVDLNMEGGAMGGLRQGIYQGKMMSTRALVQAGQIWTFNGVAGLPETPLLTALRGEIIRIPIVNNTAFAHAIHLHGTHFQEVLPGGGFGPLRDTILLDRGDSREIAFRADNPGKWLFHCHMLSHQAAGMRTWIEVS